MILFLAGAVAALGLAVLADVWGGRPAVEAVGAIVWALLGGAIAVERWRKEE